MSKDIHKVQKLYSDIQKELSKAYRERIDESVSYGNFQKEFY